MKVHATAPNGWSALQFAEKTKQTEVEFKFYCLLCLDNGMLID